MSGGETLFDPLAADYAAARPHYPAELYTAVARLAGVCWPDSRVIDVGAGTGIASRAMSDRGAQVVPVDPAAGMLAVLRQTGGRLPAVRATAERLPFSDRSADLVTYAQAWHWTDPPTAAAEAVRVLRPAGALAVWWNDVDAVHTGWWQRQQARLEAANPRYRRDYRHVDHGRQLSATGLFAEVRPWTGRWCRRLDLDRYARWLRSKSYVAAIGPRQEEFIADERASLLRDFPDGVVVEPFRVRLWVALPR